MKLHTKILTIGIVFLFLSKNCVANTPECRLLFSITSKNKGRLGVINSGDNSMAVTIIGSDNGILFSRTIQKYTNFFQMVDLGKLPDGTYYVKLKGNKLEFEKQFLIKNNIAKITIGIVDDEPVFHFNNEKILTVAYLNSKKMPIDIIIEANNEIVFEDKGLTDCPFNKRYSLGSLPNGSYMVKLTAGQWLYEYAFILKK